MTGVCANPILPELPALEIFMYKTRLNSLAFSFLLSFATLISSCSDEVVVPTPVAPITVDPATAATTATQSLIPTPLPPLDEKALNNTPEVSPEQQEVAQAFVRDLGIQLVSDGSVGIQSVAAFQANSPIDGSALWVAYTIGIRNFDPLQNHALGIYKRVSEGWKQLALFEMADVPSPASTNTQQDEIQPLSPDYLGEGSVFPVTIEPARLWLQVDGGMGAHSGIFALLSFDGTTIKQEASGFSASPGAGSVEDVNGDGMGEVILDNSDYYIFCYACGVRAPDYSILRWDGASMVTVEPQSLPADATADLRTLNERMITQARAGLWKDALNTMAQISAQPLKDTSDTLQWNLAWLRVNGEARRLQAESQGGAYLLLDQVYFGDFSLAVDAMRGYSAESIFNPNSPLIVGTVAEGNQEALSTALLSSVNNAIQLYPDDLATAPAYFLRAWASYLQGDRTSAVSDLQQASALAPNDKLFDDSLRFLIP